MSVRGTKALAKGHTQYISDPSGMIDARTTAPAPKQNPQAKGKIIDRVSLHTGLRISTNSRLSFPAIHILASCSGTMVSVLVIVSRVIHPPSK